MKFSESDELVVGYIWSQLVLFEENWGEYYYYYYYFLWLCSPARAMASSSHEVS
jgi:hypothetical protein